MEELVFLPSWPPPDNNLLLFGLLLLAGLIGGQLFGHMLRLPRITGYLVAGLLLGPRGLNWLSNPLLENARLFVDIPLGLVLFELGRRLDYHWLRRNHWLLLTGGLESIATFVAIYFTLDYFGVPPLYAAMAGAIGVSSSPAVALLVAQELRAEGQVTERALTLVAINSAFAFVLFTMFFSHLHLRYQAGWLTVALHPLYLLIGSALLGYLMGIATIGIGRRIGKREGLHFILFIAMIVISIGVAQQLKLSELIALLVFGVLSRNLDRDHVLLPVELGRAGQLFFVILFVFAGAKIEFGELENVGWVAAAYIAARYAAKAAVVLALARGNGINFKQASLLGIALVPMPEFAIIMVQSIAELYPQFGARLAAIVLSATAILELLGPIATQLALKLSGEAHPDKTGEA